MRLRLAFLYLTGPTVEALPDKTYTLGAKSREDEQINKQWPADRHLQLLQRSAA